MSGAADVSQSQTRAYIAGGAQVNTAGSTSAEQGVRVIAAHDHSYVAVSGSLSAAGFASVTPAVSFGLLKDVTEAFVQSATVKAAGDIRIEARATEDVLTVSATLSAAQPVNVMGAAALFAVDHLTRAFIHAATVTADGTVAVLASDTTDLTLVTGALEVKTTVGIGASLGISMITKDTRAYIDGDADVDGRALTGAGISAYTGEVPVENPLTTHTIRGVVVQATSAENIVDLAIAGTPAHRDVTCGSSRRWSTSSTPAPPRHDDAQINQVPVRAATQSVVVAAANTVDLFAAGGAGVIKTKVAIGASSAVGLIRNDTQAFIGRARWSRRSTTLTCWR